MQSFKRFGQKYCQWLKLSTNHHAHYFNCNSDSASVSVNQKNYAIVLVSDWKMQKCQW